MPPIFSPHIREVILEIPTRLSKILLRDCHPLECNFSVDFRSLGWVKSWSAHHISNNFHCQIQFALCCFRSLLLTASQLISFPPGTKTFQFPGFPTISGLIKKSHSEIPGSKPTCGSPGLFAACHVLRRCSSQAIPLIV